MTHPGIEAITGFLAESGLMSGTIDEKRAAMEHSLAAADPPPGVQVRSTALGGRPAEWIAPHGGREDAAVLYLHGGGYCIGSLGTHRDLAAGWPSPVVAWS